MYRLTLTFTFIFLAGKRGDSVISSLEDLKLAKQEDARNAQPKETGQQTVEDSESSDTDSSDIDNKSPVASAKEPTTDTVQAPVELKGEVSFILSFLNFPDNGHFCGRTGCHDANTASICCKIQCNSLEFI